MTGTKDGWAIRRVRYDVIHNVDAATLDKLVQSLDIKDGNVVLDGMAGYGGDSKAIHEYCAKRGIKIRLILLDKSKEQMDMSYDYLKGIECKRIVEDIRSCSIPSSSVDRVVIKMGIHEVPKKDQQLIVNHIFRILKSGGIFSVWDPMPLNRKDQLLFQDIIRKKDELAGFESFVKERYFYRQDEIEKHLAAAGFKDIEFYHEIKYRLSTEKRLDAEFGGDESRLAAWNDYIRQRVPNSMKAKLNCRDSGHTIEMTFRKGIIRARK